MAAMYLPPPPLNITSGNVAENFKTWKRLFEVHFSANQHDAATVGGATQVAILLSCAGPDAIRVFDQFEWADEGDKKKYKVVLGKLEGYCNPLESEVVSSHKFWSLKYYSPFDNFLTDLRALATECNFGTLNNRLIRDKLVFVAKGSLLKKLLDTTDLTLDKAVRMYRVDEATANHSKEMELERSVERLNVKSKRDTSREPDRDFQARGPDKRFLKYNCNFCGKKHLADMTECPAYGKKCKICDRPNHFAACCKAKKMVQYLHEQRDEDSQSQYSQSESEQVAWLGAVHEGGNRTVRAKMMVNDCEILFDLDSGAEVNTIRQQYVLEDQVKPTSLKLTMWNKSSEKPLGETTLEVLNPRSGETSAVDFVVVPNHLNCLLGISAVQHMNLVTINRGNFNLGAVSSTRDIGDLGEVHLYTADDVQPRALPARTVPIALRERVKTELDRMSDLGIIEKVDTPTEWVSQMAVVEKSDGSLRICIDPQSLNVALKREHFKLPTFDDVLPQLTDAKIFSRLDVQSAFWHVRLDEESSLLTTMATPFGRYKWKRLPFGLKVSSEIFQKRLLQGLEGLEGVLCVADDIVVVGRGDTLQSAKQDHDKNLKALQERCVKEHIKLNDKKSNIEKSSITFMGHVVSDKGISPDPAKVEAVRNMPIPTDAEGVRRICGFFQYLARFLPNLADDLKPLRKLTHDGVPWNWTKECDEALLKVKSKVTESPVLAYYDPAKELTVQVDSSEGGIGAALLQDGRPIEFASRTMTPTETRYAQIEKECLAVVFGLERFDQYTYGREVTIQNDHKPLSSILRKPLSQSPKRLQAMILRIRRYDINFVYLEGKKLVLAETLSRAPLTSTDRPVEVHAIKACKHLNVSDKRIKEIREATEHDEVLQTLTRTILDGWPDKSEDISENIRIYFDTRDTLSVYEGLVFKGERIVIPQSMRKVVKERLHAAHLGRDSMLRRARELVYWPSMKKEISQIADRCEVCLEAKPQNQKETLTQHEPADQPWEKVGVDLFSIANRDYLVTVDYYSGFWEIDYLPTTSSEAVVTKLKSHFARYGIPIYLMSDNGPQFSASEFARFGNEWGFIHLTSSPGYPRSNGRAEAAVKAAKTMMKKAAMDKKDQYAALLELRNTPVQSHEKKPKPIVPLSENTGYATHNKRNVQAHCSS